MTVWQFTLALTATTVAVCLTTSAMAVIPAGTQAKPQPGVQTRVAYVVENRALIFAADRVPYAQVLKKRLGLTVCLQVVSPLLQHPNCYDHVRIVTDVLNTGHTLTPVSPRFEQIVPVHSRLYDRMRQFGDVGFPVVLRFLAPSPKAAEIRELIGSVDVMAGGKNSVITLVDPAALAGHPISNATLRKAGVHLRVVAVTKVRHAQFLVVKIMAPAGVFQSMSVVQKGTVISGGYIIAQLPKGEDQLMIPLSQSVTALATLRVSVLTGWHEYRVPFTLQHIPLPAAPPPAGRRP